MIAHKSLGIGSFLNDLNRQLDMTYGGFGSYASKLKRALDEKRQQPLSVNLGSGSAQITDKSIKHQRGRSMGSLLKNLIAEKGLTKQYTNLEFESKLNLTSDISNLENLLDQLNFPDTGSFIKCDKMAISTETHHYYAFANPDVYPGERSYAFSFVVGTSPRKIKHKGPETIVISNGIRIIIREDTHIPIESIHKPMTEKNENFLTKLTQEAIRQNKPVVYVGSFAKTHIEQFLYKIFFLIWTSF